MKPPIGYGSDVSASPRGLREIGPPENMHVRTFQVEVNMHQLPHRSDRFGPITYTGRSTPNPYVPVDSIRTTLPPA
jgi:hypothetical protein